jgi:uncharacterized membrane protein YphA (DoxX/SURF4 family)
MNLIQKAGYWGDAHHPRWLDILRIILGSLLFAKGLFFITDTESVHRLINSTQIQPVAWAAVHYIVFSHLVGGFFIAIGLLTRYAVLFQLPILIGAVFLVHLRNGLTFLNSDLWIAIFLLILLVVFLVVGSGKYSYDEKLKNSNAL